MNDINGKNGTHTPDKVTAGNIACNVEGVVVRIRPIIFAIARNIPGHDFVSCVVVIVSIERRTFQP